MTRMKNIYLAGGIAGLDDDAAMSWREYAKRELWGLYRFLDPMDRDYRGRTTNRHEEIISGDLSDIQACTFVLANVSHPSWGTAMEIRYCWHECPRPVIAFGAGADPSPWLVYHTTSLVATIDDAIEVCRARTT